MPACGRRSNALRKRKSQRARQAWQRRVSRRVLQLWFSQACAGSGLRRTLNRIGQQQRADLLDTAMAGWCAVVGIERRKKEQASM